MDKDSLSREDRKVIAKELKKKGFQDVKEIVASGERTSFWTAEDPNVNGVRMYKNDLDRSYFFWFLRQENGGLNLQSIKVQNHVYPIDSPRRGIVNSRTYELKNGTIPNKEDMDRRIEDHTRRYKMVGKLYKSEEMLQQFAALGFDDYKFMVRNSLHHGNQSIINTRQLGCLNDEEEKVNVNFEFLLVSPTAGAGPYIASMKVSVDPETYRGQIREGETLSLSFHRYDGLPTKEQAFKLLGAHLGESKSYFRKLQQKFLHGGPRNKHKPDFGNYHVPGR